MNKKIMLTCILNRKVLGKAFSVKLYENNINVFQTNVNSLEPLDICANLCNKPYLIISSLTGALPSVIKVDINKETPSKLEVKFYISGLNKKIIRIYYSDQYYDIPIKEGEITLWKMDHIQ